MFFLVLTQFIVFGAYSFICLYVQGEVASQSAIFGGLVYCIPYVVTSLYLNKPGADTAAKVMMKAYIGLAYKIALSAALFVYFFKFTQINLLSFFISYILAFVVQCIMSVGFIKRN